MEFSFYPLQFKLRAREPIVFGGMASNQLRGVFGLSLREHASPEMYRHIFEPQPAGPSGFKNPPRPFAFRAAHLDWRKVAAGELFAFGLNVFDTRMGSLLAIRDAFQAMRQAELEDFQVPEIRTIQLEAGEQATSELRIDFVTPLELKVGGEVASRLLFGDLFARIRDRISLLRAFYGPGPLEIDFKAMASRAKLVQETGGRIITANEVQRRSSRTGQTHNLGGLTGWAAYAGELAAFVPYLRVAEWTGVGRQCVWGKGQIRITHCK